jgi:hypothetical protein
MPLARAQRLIALAAIALLAVVIGIAITSGRGDSGSSEGLPERVGPWRSAHAAPWGGELAGATTACGVRLRSASLGLADPVLPCGTKLYIGYRDQDLLTQVIAPGPVARGSRFGLTPALADKLGISGRVTLRWSYAR